MSSLKKASAVALGVALSLNMASASEHNGATISPKVLKVGCDAAFAPFTYTDDKGKLIGFDVDLINAIGNAIGYKVEIQGYPFDGIIPTLITNNIDLIISGFTISEERAKRVDFSEPYYRCGLTFLVKKEDASEFDSFDKLKNSEICAQIGTTGALYLQKEFKDIRLKQFNSPPETYLELQNGGCDVVVNDRPVNDFFLAQNPKNKENVISHEILSAQNEYYGIAVRKGNKELLDLINQGLQQVIESGEFAKISIKWFGYDITENLKGTVDAQAILEEANNLKAQAE